MAASYFWLVGVRRGYKFLQNSHGHFIATADTNWILEKFITIEGEAMVLQGALCEAVIRAFSRASTALGTEHLRDSFALDGIPPDDSAESPAPYHSPPDDSAESPAPAISPCDESTQQYYATKLRYFDLSLYGEEVDRDIDSSYI
ncbi:hypothetical protein QL285_056692 [Trifolium repens]|nr:hypothetical protein QL285_056692 [Trifolium repens]